jgi:precorrin-6Y C5,15-methyltransferase (decarboxylating)
VKKFGENWLVFASGDPLFFGIGNTLKRELPDANFVFYPVFNSLQLLAHRFGINYGEFKTVSLTGRDWHAFDKALLHGEKRLAILTDRKNTPATIAQRMLEFGYNNYRMFYGQCLGGENERIVELSLQGAATFPFSHPNCFFLEMTEDRIPRKGIPETDFEILEGRPKMITKMAIRMLTLAALQLHNKKLFWDVGACTGSVSIEARLHFPDVKVVAFEKRKESLEIIKKNARKFQTPGIQLFIGDYAEMDKANQEQPDAVFLGGYGGKMEVILNDVNAHLLHGGIIVFNSVSEQSENSFLCWARKNNYQLQIQQKLAVDEHNPISILAIKKQ